MTLKKPLKDLTRRELLQLNSSLKKSCQFIIGKKKNISVRTYSKLHSENYGLFDPDVNTIVIFRGGIPTVGKYVEIFIHEWVHSVQTGLKKNYSKMDKKYGYWNNPYEIEAREGEKIYRSPVWKLTKFLMTN